MDMAIHFCHLPSPHPLCGQLQGVGRMLEEGKVLSKTRSLSSFGQWLTESRDPLESFNASRGTKVVSGARKTDGTEPKRRLGKYVCMCDLGQLRAGCHMGILTVSVS